VIVIRTKEDVRNQDFFKGKNRQKHIFHFGSLYFGFIKIDINNGPVLTEIGVQFTAGTAFHCRETCQVPHFTLCYNYTRIFKFLFINIFLVPGKFMCCEELFRNCRWIYNNVFSRTGSVRIRRCYVYALQAAGDLQSSGRGKFHCLIIAVTAVPRELMSISFHIESTGCVSFLTSTLIPLLI
jgi:hypothetical protein